MVRRVTGLFKNAFGGLDRSIWLLALTQFINRVGTMVVFFLSVYLHDELGFDLGKVGIAMALFGAGSLLGTFIGGKLVDKIGYYPVMLSSLISGGIMFIVVGHLENFVVLCCGIFLMTATAEAFRPANMTAVSFYSNNENYTRAISLNRLAINLGFSFGPAIGGFLAAYNYQLIFWVDGTTCILAAAVVFFFLENKHHNKPVQKSDGPLEKGRSALNDRIFLWFLPITMLYAMSFFQFFSTMPLYYKEVEHLDESQIGWLMALNGFLVAAIEMVMIYKIQNRWSIYNFIALGAFLVFVSYLSLLFAGGYAWMFVITIVISFSEMFAMPFMNTFMNNRAHTARKGQYSSLYAMSWSAAQICTPLIATTMIAWQGYDGLWIVLGLVALIVFFGVLMIGKMVAGEPS